MAIEKIKMEGGEPCMDLETLSNRFLDDLENESTLTHYGVKGMKWGVRKDRQTSGTKKKKKSSILWNKNKRREGETAAQYTARLNRESQERIAKINAREKAASEKRMLKSQERIQKMQYKESERQRAAEERQRKEKAKAEKIARKEQASKTNPKTDIYKSKNVKNMSDQEVRDAINRYRLEQEYKNAKNAVKAATRSVGKKTLNTVGEILLNVGKKVVTDQLADVANQNLDLFLYSKNLKKISNVKKAQQEAAEKEEKKRKKAAEEERKRREANK